MSNTNIKAGSPSTGHIMFIGAAVHATLGSKLKIPDNYITIKSQASWTNLNRGKLSKKQRRI